MVWIFLGLFLNPRLCVTDCLTGLFRSNVQIHDHDAESADIDKPHEVVGTSLRKCEMAKNLSTIEHKREITAFYICCLLGCAPVFYPRAQVYTIGWALTQITQFVCKSVPPLTPSASRVRPCSMKSLQRWTTVPLPDSMPNRYTRSSEVRLSSTAFECVVIKNWASPIFRRRLINRRNNLGCKWHSGSSTKYCFIPGFCSISAIRMVSSAMPVPRYWRAMGASSPLLWT